MKYEFESVYTVDTGDLTATGTGSGVHLYKDITLNFEITDRYGSTMVNSVDIMNNASIGNMLVSILDTGGAFIYPNYYSGRPLKSFAFEAQNNIDIFGSYQKDFGILVDIEDNTAGQFDSVFYLYGNVPEISGAFVTDKDGLWLYTGSLEESYDSYYVINEYDGRTAQIGPDERYIIFDVIFSNDSQYIKYKNFEIYTGSGLDMDLETIIPFKSIPIFNQSNNVSFRLENDGLNYDTPYYFTIIPYSELGSGERWIFGPHAIAAPIPIASVGQFDILNIINGSETGDISLITGEIPTTGITTIDTIPINTYHSIDYVSKIKDDNCEIYGSRISLVITGCSGTGHSFSEYSISANSNINFSTSTDVNNVYLTAQVDTAPATYKLYKTSI